MLDFLNKIKRIFTKKDLLYYVLISCMMFIGAFIEVVSIGAVIPVFTILSSSDAIFENRYLSFAYSLLGCSNKESFILRFILIIFTVFVIKNLYMAIVFYVQSYFLHNSIVKISLRMFRTYLFQPYSFHLNKNSALLLRNIQQVDSVVNGILGPIFSILSESMVIIVITIALLMRYTFIVFLIILILFISLFFFHYAIKRVLNKYGEMRTQYGLRLIRNINQALGGIKETKLMHKEDFFVDLFKYQSQNLNKSSHMYNFILQIPKLYIELVSVMVFVILISVLISIGKDFNSTLMTCIIFAVASTRLMPSVNRITTSLSTIHFYSPMLDQILSDIDTTVFTNLLPAPENLRTLEFRSEISMNNLTYSYDKQKKILSSISLKIHKNFTVGFVGHSGAGKTTLIDILLGLLSPSKGELLVDGEKITKENLRAWQKILGYVPQMVYLTDDTIRNNIAFGVPQEKIDESKVINAVNLSQLEDFIKGLPFGLDTVVGERGVRISGGEKQRIGIARALYHDPQVLVLDEATASLDNNTERALMESINSLHRKITIIIIAHRLSTVKYCDKIFFLSEGKLISEGTYDELLKKCPEFRQIAFMS